MLAAADVPARGFGLAVGEPARIVPAAFERVQMLIRLALIDLLIVLAPVMMLLWVLPQPQGRTRWWTRLFPLTVFQQAVQMVALRLGSSLMVELTPGSVSDALLTLLLGIAVCWSTPVPAQSSRSLPQAAPRGRSRAAAG